MHANVGQTYTYKGTQRKKVVIITKILVKFLFARVFSNTYKLLSSAPQRTGKYFFVSNTIL